MINNNLVALMGLIFSGTSGFKFKNFKGEETYWANRNLYNMFLDDRYYTTYDSSNTDAGIYMLLGSGATQPTPDDYKMDSIIDGYSVIDQKHTVFTEQCDGQLLLIYRTIQNTSDSPIIINETGLFGWNIMIAREVLDEPVILEPGKKHTFTMNIGLE